jgi:hypothetical protein
MMISLAASTWAAVAPMIAMSAVAIAAAAPFIVMGAAVVALSIGLALLVEDVMAFMSGGDSMIGGIAEKWPIVGEIIRGIVAAVSFAFDTLKAFWGFLFDVVTAPIETLNKVKNAIADFKVIQVIIDAVKSLIAVVAEAVAGFQTLMDLPGKAVGAVKDFFGFGSGEESDGSGEESDGSGEESDIEKGKSAINIASNSPIAAQTSSSIANSSKSSSRNTSVQTGDIIIQSQATDAEGIAREVGGSLSSQMRAAVDDFDNGIDL